MTELMGNWKRTSMCAETSKLEVGAEVLLMGWAQRRRDLGSLMFVWLRDRSGIVQLVFDQSEDATLFEKAGEIKTEYVLAVKGTVRARAEKDINPDLATGKIEIVAKQLKILNTSETPPFMVEAENVSDEVRLKYRYIDLRRAQMQRALMLKHKVTRITREFLDSHGFVDIETPILTRSTPEGARDYLVPSRLHNGEFYALPQSPQLFKQLLMVSGMDRYYQIAKCFRDEDLRANRQPEFQQIDMELSFVDQYDIINIVEEFLPILFRECAGYEVQTPLRRLTYAEAMSTYGSDKPDLRFEMCIKDATEAASGCPFPVFANAVQEGGKVCALVAQGAAERFTRKELDAMAELVKTFKAKGLAWLLLDKTGARGSFTKLLTDDFTSALSAAVGAKEGDAVFFVADRPEIVYNSLGALRLHLGAKLDLIDKTRHELLWVMDFPFVEYSEEEGRYVAQHHPFTAPLDEDAHLVSTDIAKVRTKTYDIVCDGYEVGGGSIRIHDQNMQEKVFEALSFTPQKAQERFGFFLDALKYGTPPHGGLAFGLDRLVMVLGGYENIRDVIAFPKVQSASCLMSDAPNIVEDKQLEELGIGISKKS